MDDIGRTIAALRDELTPAWNEAHADQLFANIHRLQRLRRFRRRAGGCTLVAACLLALGVGRLNLPDPARSSQFTLVEEQQPRVARAELGSDPIALMDAADSARSSDKPQAAVEYLRRVLRDHTQSPVAPFAAFTLGRVLLESLGEPVEAAEAFSLARRYAPEGTLAQDALAREVEAFSKAGQSREAYERAQLYLQLYPTGRRLRAVRLFGGLE